MCSSDLNAGAAFTGTSISAATIGNSGSLLTGTLTTALQPNITSIGTLGTNITITANANITGQSFSNVKSVIKETAITTSATGNINVGFGPSNIEIATFHMSGNITLVSTGIAYRGARKEMFFYNNTGSSKIVTSLNSRNNKGNTNISVANGTVASITFVVTDDTTANIFGIVSNV